MSNTFTYFGSDNAPLQILILIHNEDHSEELTKFGKKLLESVSSLPQQKFKGVICQVSDSTINNNFETKAGLNFRAEFFRDVLLDDEEVYQHQDVLHPVYHRAKQSFMLTKLIQESHLVLDLHFANPYRNKSTFDSNFLNQNANVAPVLVLPSGDSISQSISFDLPSLAVIKGLGHKLTAFDRNGILDWCFYHSIPAIAFHHLEYESNEKSHQDLIHLTCKIFSDDATFSSDSKPKHAFHAKESVIARGPLHYTKSDWKNLEFVPHGQIIATDDFGSFKCKSTNGAFLMELNSNPKENQLAWTWMVEDEIHEAHNEPNPRSISHLLQLSESRLYALPTSSHLNFSQLMEATLELGSPNATAHYLIIGAIHGNEKCGIRAINELFSENYFSAFLNSPSNVKNVRNKKITLLLGNPKAYSRNQRFLHENLNRVMLPDTLSSVSSITTSVNNVTSYYSSHSHKNSNDTSHNFVYERERAVYIASHVQRAHVILDIHSTSSETPAFVLPAPNKESVKIARQMPVPFVVTGVVDNIPGTTLLLAQDLGKTGVTVECGQHDNPLSIATAKACIKAILNMESLSDSDISDTSPIVMHSPNKEIVKKGFRYIRKVEAFEKVAFQELVAMDDGGEIRCPYEEGAYIVMPTSLPFIGEEAWFWGRMTSSIDTFDTLPLTSISQYVENAYPFMETFGPQHSPFHVVFSFIRNSNEISPIFQAINQLKSGGHFDELSDMRVTLLTLDTSHYVENKELTELDTAFSGLHFGPHSKYRHVADVIASSTLYLEFVDLPNKESKNDMRGAQMGPLPNYGSRQLVRQLEHLLPWKSHRKFSSTLTWAYANRKVGTSVIIDSEDTENSIEISKRVITQIVKGQVLQGNS